MTVEDLARQACQAVEDLARQMTAPGDIPAPDLATVIAELAAMTRTLPRVLDQIGVGLDARADRVRLDGHGEDRYPSAGTAVGVARLALAEAADAARTLGRATDEAWQVMATMGERWDG